MHGPTCFGMSAHFAYSEVRAFSPSPTMLNRPPKGSFTRPHESDEALDKALGTGPTGRRQVEEGPGARGPGGPSAPGKGPEVELKRQWDEELEAELSSAMEGFDETSLTVPRSGRSRASDREGQPKGGVGQEERSGVQKAKVVGIRGDVVFLDLGAKSEGIVPLSQFDDEVPQPGEVIEVVFDRFDREEGLLVMSVKGAAVEATWNNLRKGLVVEARVTKVVKGGVEVDVDGIRGFMPISQIDLNRVEDAQPYVNQRFRVSVTEANHGDRNLVVSRKELLLREREEMREKTWAELEEGQVRRGTVRSMKDFGAFVDLGGVDGLLHISDMSWIRKNDVKDVVQVGQELDVKVLKIDRENKKLSLGLKQLIASPWDDIEDKYERGQNVKGRVTRITDFGAFVELEPGIEGLVHISELSTKRVVRVKDFAQPDQEVEARILEIDPEQRRIALSMKAPPAVPTPEPEEAEHDTPPASKPERKMPLKGGLGDRDRNPFNLPPR